ncbi:aminotransferase class I/II-fold pyridoxal phosphate-dependent enzyme [Pedobacter cryophilus]|uniref:Pyridoxal phosphate-dependent aminotransferase family protein n=1 Tax=Pedobacter cryophilus TaxID=2571271 RepID=A0A4U1C1R6_9SPHI|nr:pyridoxal phosphate-dependent aminotransferase family protein [Pedobacter cryophilus]TKB97843.1 pyridoxal phosphate-dependent aminotransferase family protein [Pedobacter cryophilus]
MTNFLINKINQRVQNNSLRELKIPNSLIDFSSNDYLGFAKSAELKEKIETFTKDNPSYFIGATGSRLLSGNSQFVEELEAEISIFHQAEAGLIFNSGYDANIGLLSSIAQRGDTIITDELIHASLIDGARLSNANRYIFKHNDLESLAEKLKNSKGNIFVVTESVFSMDGDFAPLKEISDLAKKYEAHLIVDEAHATGVFGAYGQGLVNHLNLENEVFARIHTFGKALGCHGAIILGSKELRTYLINFARSFIYTTALPFHSLVSVKNAYELLKTTPAIKQLATNIELFRSSTLKNSFIKSESAIQCKIVSGNQQCKNMANQIQANGFDVKAILSPTVPEGKERLRICLHAYHTPNQIKSLINLLANYE